MVFNSAAFLLIFLPISLLVYRCIEPVPSLRILTLLIISLIFYGMWNAEFVGILVTSIVGTWAAAKWYSRARNSWIVTLAISCNLLLLGAYKYADFIADSLTSLTGVSIGRLHLTLPVGISFFTFHHVMYLADLRRRRAEATTFDRYALYITFFPQAAAGPLTRWSEVGEQYGRAAFGPGWEQRWALGITFLVIGLVQKVGLGDPIGRVINPIFQAANSGALMDGSAWLALAFGLQIFFDFSGYSDMAIGIALLFGIRLPDNFAAPFRAPSILLFWQRWHMTFSRFLRDYVFLPLADMRVAGTRHTPVQYVLAIITTMALCGLWHGAGWNFVLWGVLHGVAIVAALGWRRYAFRLPAGTGWAFTVMFFLLSGIIFRAESLGAAWNVFTGLTALPSAGMLGKSWIILVAMACATLLPSSRVLCTRIAEQPRMVVPFAFGLTCIGVMVLLGESETYEFIYFRF